MAQEPFLVNPPKRKKKGIPSSLLRKMTRRWGPKRAMKKAWEEMEKKKKNPFGEEVMIVGLNPRRRRRGKVQRKRAASKKIAHKKKKRVKTPSKKKKIVVAYQTGPKTYTRSAYSKSKKAGIKINRPRRRRNPAVKNMFDVKSALPHVAVGAGSAIAVAVAPSIIPVQAPVVKYGVQLGTVVGGGLLLGKTVKDKSLGITWAITGSAVILADILKTYVLQGMFGLSDVESAYALDAYPNEADEGFAAFPDEQSLEAYPDEADEGFAAFPDEQYPL